MCLVPVVVDRGSLTRNLIVVVTYVTFVLDGLSFVYLRGRPGGRSPDKVWTE